MTDRPDTAPDLPEVPVEEGRAAAFSLIWLVPIVALAIALWTAWRTYADQGPLIEVRFQNAAGVTADETELRFRDIGVGLVEEVAFSADLQEVVVSIRVEPEMAPYIDDGARFWVVRPQVSAQGVTGLDTVLSGVYIQGVWDGVAGEEQTSFRGLDEAPLLGAEQQGTTFILRSDMALPTAETPILFKGVEVGRIDSAEVMPDGTGVETEAVIFEPFEGLVTTSTRFWDISGFSFSVGPGGARLNFTSVASLLTGGVTFETLGSGGAPLETGMVFELFADEDAARDDFLVAGEGLSVTYTMIFEENLSGLSAGAPVELGGLRVGDVAAISGLVDPERFGDTDVRLLAQVRINPERLGLGAGASDTDLTTYLEGEIADGLRGRLTNAGLLTGGLKIELVQIPFAEAASLDTDADPYPILPTAPPDVTDVTATAQGLLSRIDDLPVEELLEEAIAFLDSAEALVSSEAVTRSPEELLATLAAIRQIAESEETQGLPGRISGLTAELQQASARVSAILAELEEAEAATRITTAVESIGTAADSLPGLVAEAESLLARAGELPLEDLVAQASDLVAAADGLVSGEAAQALPADVQATLAELRGTLASVRGIADSEEVQALPGQISALATDLSGVATSLDGLLTEIETAGTVEAVTATVDSVRAAADAVPALTAEANALIAEARELPLDELVADASAILGRADALLAQDSTQALTGQAGAAIEELRATIASVRGIAQSDEVQALPGQVSALATDLQTASTRLNGLLAEIEEAQTVERLTGAISDVATAAEGLPGVVAQAEALLGQAGELPLEDFVSRTTELLDAAEAILAQDSARALPGELNATLAEARGTLAQLREGGLVENANATLSSARAAADALAEASASLPSLADQLSSLATQAGATFTDFDRDSAFARDLRGAIRQVQAAATAVERLARTLERNPNSLILGR
ncbi:MlaD family protein [Histidinibacterium lentulum]|uniref:MCE family protein n=1 Tax=Histidinibacterium lentulum TaxID=2480588 RepID=A0A3N2R8H3_9RHOB|nr:MlaD family protein [Histidinibacterium lentulum]ROU03735.1 MCE family protein [Histidinibacterium lentulum]